MRTFASRVAPHSPFAGLALGLGVGVALGVLLALIPSCGGDINPTHCSVLTGDATCAALYPNGALPFCSAGCQESPHGNGCVASLPEDSCYSPCGQNLTVLELDSCIDPEPGTGTGTPEDTTSSTSRGSSSTAAADDGSSSGATTASGCTSDDECDAGLPFCMDGECVPCSLTPDPAAACVALDPARPLCADDLCVACTSTDQSACVGSTPLCNVLEGTCIGCTRHDQCPDSACHIEDGSCLPADRVWWVDGDAGSCAAADGSELAPYCTIASALANVGVGEAGTLWVRARRGDAAYAAGFTITGGRVVAVRGLPDERPRFSGGGVGAPITVSGGAVAYLERGRVDSSAVTEAIGVVGAVLHLDGWLVVLNSGGGISLTNGATLRAQTSVLGANGSALVDAQALRASASDFELRYVTMAGNDGTGVASITCTGGSAGVVRNSIVAGLEPSSIDCPGVEIEHSAIDTMLLGDGVVLLETFDPGWFLAPGSGDFHLELGHPFDDVAWWRPGDPLVDLDGDPRPGGRGGPDVAGADR